MSTMVVPMVRRMLVGIAALAGAACASPDRGAADTATAARRAGADSPAGVGGAESILLATTTSTHDSGLLDSLLPAFERQTGVRVKPIAVGTGAALDMAARGNADAVLVHAPESERKYVESGDLVGGQLVMHNDFLIVGPANDPAGVKRAGGSAGGIDAAMRAIARTGPFVSRGDGSGTEKMELALWKAAGVDTTQVAKREATGQGMGATLTVANEHRGYTLTDRATYLALKERLSLVPLVEGDPRLLNVYHAYVVNPEKHAKVKREAAEAFVAFLVAPATQEMIGRFGVERYGQPLFVPDAGKPDPTGAPARAADTATAGPPR